MKRIDLERVIKPDVWLEYIQSHGFVMQKKLSTALIVGLSMTSAWTVGKTVWMVGGDVSPIPTWSSPSVRATQSAHQSLDVNGLKQSQLFGAYHKKPVAAVEQVIRNAPKTRLNLTLVGTSTSSEPHHGVAVIANSGQQSTYGVDDVITGTRAKLKAVLIDRVIIENNGHDETLMLKGVKYSALSASRNQPIAPIQDTQMPAAKRSAIIAQIVEQPRKLLQYVGFSPVSQKGRIIGYRVTPGKSPDLFMSLGLKPGDVATQANGYALTDPSSLAKIFHGIIHEHRLDLTVERNGQPRDINVKL